MFFYQSCIEVFSEAFNVPYVHIESGNGLMPLGNKTLSEPILTSGVTKPHWVIFLEVVQWWNETFTLLALVMAIYNITHHHILPWWRHQMETISALLTLCAGNSSVTGEFPAQRPVTRGFDVFFDLRLNKHLSKQSWCRWFETPSRSLWHHWNDKWEYNICQTGTGCRKTIRIPFPLFLEKDNRIASRVFCITKMSDILLSLHPAWRILCQIAFKPWVLFTALSANITCVAYIDISQLRNCNKWI